MAYTGINVGNLKNNNRSAILKLLNDQVAMSRKDIAAALGLTPATVTVICSELIDAGILCELGELQDERRAGRKKILVGINYDRYFVLSVSIESAETCVSLTNMIGERGRFTRIRTDAEIPPEEFLERIAAECKALIRKSGVSKGAILGVGVSVPGDVRRENGLSLHAYRVWNEPVEIGGFLSDKLGLPVIVDNNVRAFAEAELIFGSGKDFENMLFIKWGPGVGSAIVIGKQLYNSNRSKNAEIGHFVMDPKGAACRCGRRGCLETFVGTHAMAEQLRLGCTKERMPRLYEQVGGDLTQISARNFTGFLELDDPAMWRIIDGDVEMLARSVCHVITMLDPDRVVLYGRLFEQSALMERFLADCKALDPRYDESYIIRSELWDKIDFIGPLALVVNQLFLSGQAE